MYRRLFLLFLMLPFWVNAQEVLEDKVYEGNIQSVQLYRKGLGVSAQMNAPVIPLGSAGLILEFDDLAFEPDRYSAALVHCNSDWTASGLKPADYIRQYNEFNVNTYEYSINTRIPYIHFTFNVPAVTKSGNYLMKVYRNRNKEEVILTKRFMVYDDQVKVGAAIMAPSQTAERRTGQQIDIKVNYAARELVDPARTVKVVVRQNQRWDNAKIGTKPTFIRDDRSVLEYQFFNGENIFDAGNEFRFVDLRYVRTTGRNIASVSMEDDVVYAETAIGKPRAQLSYLEYLDLNGQYIVENLERGNPKLESEYVLVTFNAQMDDVEGEPYIFGALSNWGKADAAKMTYDAGKGVYQSSFLLKQGWYDFLLAVKKGEEWDTLPVEGSHYQTENEYDVLVYYRDFGSRYDELLGYISVNANKKRF
ncbi:type IX secretion system plug protein [Echinicola shivajiensis]|uniref:type IX secretion system plug protein n=1 Tax=Echinicola shivajiensis TaxID=1035916 RepID=UPI001BFC5BDE|nr:type IX secretion system plug protein domain-containing protein [Echinicola shivajiensis]